VAFSSAQWLTRIHSYMVEDANHMEVCKPPSKEHSSYELLLQFINICQEASLNNLVSLIRHLHGSLT
jgi:hypothetical protein